MYEAIVIGVSKGGMFALKTILSALPKGFSIPIIIVQHQGEGLDMTLTDLLNNMLEIEVNEASVGEDIKPGHVYLSPAKYHLLIEADKTFSLSIDPPLNFSIPSIDVLFESAAEAYREKLVGIILTGANADGSRGLKMINDNGGLSVVQDPSTAEAAEMPEAAIAASHVAHVLPLNKIGEFILRLSDVTV